MLSKFYEYMEDVQDHIEAVKDWEDWELEMEYTEIQNRIDDKLIELNVLLEEAEDKRLVEEVIELFEDMGKEVYVKEMKLLNIPVWEW